MTHSSPPAAPAPHAHPSYVGIFVVLAALTALELGVAFLSWPKATLIVILLLLAVWKALLVALYYMHLRFEGRRLLILAVAPLPFVVIFVASVLLEHFD